MSGDGRRRPGSQPAQGFPDHGPPRPHGRGVPDGLLVGGLALLLGGTALIWTATGLSALLAHGAWPDGAGFAGTPQAMRALLTDPRDLPGAWPDTPAGQLPRPGLFWGVLVGQLMVLLVCALCVLTFLLRRRARRAAGRLAAAAGGKPDPPPAPSSPTATFDAAVPLSELPGPAAASGRTDGTASHATTPARPPDHDADAAADAALAAGPAVPRDASPPHADAFGLVYDREGRHSASRIGQALQEATGAVLLVTADPALWQRTVGTRTKLGPVHLYDPSRRTDAPGRLRWAPHQGCEDLTTARRRAAALLAPVRPRAHGETLSADAAETLLRCCLHAAALSGAPFRQAHRWATSVSPSEAVRILRTHPRAASGSAGELEAVLVAHPERRAAASDLIRRALGALSQLHVRNACTASRPDSLALESFLSERGTLYLVAESVEDPHRGDPGTMPLLTALLSHVVEHGRRMAARSSSGRLDPPLTCILDQVAQVAPLPELPWLVANGETVGMPTLALLRSVEQTRTWWPELAAAHRDRPGSGDSSSSISYTQHPG